MTKLKQSIQGNADGLLQAHIFKCYCGEDSYLEVLKDFEDGELYISITMHPTRLKNRIKTAWKALRGLEFTASNEVIIDFVDVQELIEALQPELAQNPKEAKHE